uniref:Uncharacterized protein n=1 Tax=Anguilla anguilla TaxID=7936 RepID=A0A0E9VPD3_ANGAN
MEIGLQNSPFAWNTLLLHSSPPRALAVVESMDYVPPTG